MMKLMEDSALIVNKGIEQPPIINPHLGTILRKRAKKILSVEEYVTGIRSGNIAVLGQAITLIESHLPEHQVVAQKVIERCQPYANNSIRVGITGVPGAGKSTFIEAFGGLFTADGYKLAVLAIDPSSERSKGSILGDKTRMETLSVDPRAFIRPSPSAGSLGGVARKTRESIILCEAAGFDVIFVETVGVGQSETAVHSMTDFFLLLMLAGAGDELQGIKRGIMEMSDMLIINKADGHNVDKANMAKVQYQSALRLFPMTASAWSPIVLTCSAIEKKGLDKIREQIETFIAHTKRNGYFEQHRREQSRYWMFETIHEALQEHFYRNKTVERKLTACEAKVLNGEITSFAAAKEMLDDYFEYSRP